MTSRVNRDIQALRGVAILAVMFQHFRGRLPEYAVLERVFDSFSFWSGVDLFYAISGFVICTSLMSNSGLAAGARLKPAEFLSFLRRRFVRLAPAAWFWLAASFVFLAFVPEMIPHGSGARWLLAQLSAFTATADFYWSHCLTDPRAVCLNPDVVGVYWSLSVEEQFYLALGILLLLLSLDRLVVVLLAVAAVFTVFVLSGLDTGPFSLAWTLRPQGLALGVALAVAANKGWLSGLARVSAPARATAITLGVLAVFSMSHELPLAYAIPLIAVVGAAVVGLAIPDGAISKGPGQFAVWVGDRSYSIYLSHLMVFHVIAKALAAIPVATAVLSPSNPLSVGWMVLAFALALAVGHASYTWIERPMFLIGRRRASVTAS